MCTTVSCGVLPARLDVAWLIRGLIVVGRMDKGLGKWGLLGCWQQQALVAYVAWTAARRAHPAALHRAGGGREARLTDRTSLAGLLIYSETKLEVHSGRGGA